MKFSISLIPSVAPPRGAAIAKFAEANGFFGFWVVDEIYHRDVWMTLAACALATRKIRLGTGVTNIILRDPTLVAQAIGTLDQMAPGRTFCGISIGDPTRLSLYRHLPPMNELKPFARLRESIGVIRLLLAQGKVDFSGQFLKYSNITTTATTRNKVPLYLGGLGGPKSFQLAGEIGDGVTSAFGCSRKYHEYVLENAHLGKMKANRVDVKLPYSAWNIFCCASRSEDARDAARNYVAFYLPSIPRQILELHGVTSEAIQPIRDAFARGDLKSGLELTTDELVNHFSISGSPDEVVDKLEKNFVAGGVDELVACIVDPEIVGSMLGVKIKKVPSYPENLRLIKKQVMPHLQSLRKTKRRK
jgi:5,10-methylenetetrahydromethanopterin reductase